MKFPFQHHYSLFTNRIGIKTGLPKAVNTEEYPRKQILQILFQNKLKNEISALSSTLDKMKNVCLITKLLLIKCLVYFCTE